MAKISTKARVTRRDVNILKVDGARIRCKVEWIEKAERSTCGLETKGSRERTLAQIIVREYKIRLTRRRVVRESEKVVKTSQRILVALNIHFVER